MPAASVRNRYVNDSIATATPGQLIVMLYDRLVLDLQRAADAQHGKRREQAHNDLTHAQDIITALTNNLDANAGEMSTNLHALYTFLHAELVQANITNDPARTEWVLTQVEPLRDAWRQAGGGDTAAHTAASSAASLPAQQGTASTYGSSGAMTRGQTGSMLGRLA